jgi:acetyl esterase/lipase
MSFTLDPEVAQAFAPFAAEAAGSMPPPVGDVATRRATLDGIFGYGDTAQPFPEDVTLTDHELTTADGATIRLRWYARKNSSGEPGPAALYMHPGGFIAGNVGLFDGTVSRYVSASGTPILSVDYRLTPEHPIRARSRTPTPRWSGCTSMPPIWASTRPASACSATARAAG